jgi:hypothetical protein
MCGAARHGGRRDVQTAEAAELTLDGRNSGIIMRWIEKYPVLAAMSL